MKALVIGGTKFMGPRVVRRLAEEGHEVTVFNRGESGVPEGVRRLRGDRRLLGDHAGEIRRLSPDVVLNMIPTNQVRTVVHAEVRP